MRTIYRIPLKDSSPYKYMIHATIECILAIIACWYITYSYVGIYVFATFWLMLLWLCIWSCGYIIITDDSIIVKNPYLGYQHKYLFANIAKCRIHYGNIAQPNKFLYMQDKYNNKLCNCPIALVGNNDIPQVVKIFTKYGIAIENHIAKDS